MCASVTPVDLDDFRGVFADGWTDDDLDHVLPDLSERLGLTVRCVWEYADGLGPAGHSFLVVIGETGVFDLPGGLWELLLGEPAAGSLILPVSGGAHPDLPDPAALDDAEVTGLTWYALEARY